jgi:hypothetical protein
MADSESSNGSGWLGFLAGIIVVALIGFAIYAYTGAQPQRTAQIDLPNVEIKAPDVHLPSPPPSPAVPPQAQPAPPAQTNP